MGPCSVCVLVYMKLCVVRMLPSGSVIIIIYVCLYASVFMTNKRCCTPETSDEPKSGLARLGLAQTLPAPLCIEVSLVFSLHVAQAAASLSLLSSSMLCPYVSIPSHTPGQGCCLEELEPYSPLPKPANEVT